MIGLNSIFRWCQRHAVEGHLLELAHAGDFVEPGEGVLLLCSVVATDRLPLKAEAPRALAFGDIPSLEITWLHAGVPGDCQVRLCIVVILAVDRLVAKSSSGDVDSSGHGVFLAKWREGENPSVGA